MKDITGLLDQLIEYNIKDKESITLDPGKNDDIEDFLGLKYKKGEEVIDKFTGKGGVIIAGTRTTITF